MKQSMYRPFTIWMNRVSDETSGTSFLDATTAPYRGGRPFRPEAVVSAVSRGFTLLRNARKWRTPEVGVGNPATVAARGQQWRLVMAWGGFEIFAKGLMCHFKPSGGPHVSDFMEMVLVECPGIGDASPAFPRKKIGSTRDIESASSLIESGAADRLVWRRWLEDDEHSRWPWPDAVRLARVVRNLSAHGLLSPAAAQRVGLPDACQTLVGVLRDVADGVIRQACESKDCGGQRRG